MRFDPSTDSVRIDGNIAPEGIAAPGHEHSIYYERSAKKDRADEVAPVPAAVAVPVAPADPNAIPTVHVPIGVQVEVQPQQPAAK